jgi:hypothetical protein
LLIDCFKNEQLGLIEKISSLLTLIFSADKLPCCKATPEVKSKGEIMKKLFFLVFFIATHQDLLSTTLNPLDKKLTQWKSRYSLNKMPEEAVSSLAAAIGSLIKQGPSNPEKTSDALHTLGTSLKKHHYDCYNALIKAYEEAILAYTGKDDLDKDKIWKETLFHYYSSLHELLNKENPASSHIEQKPKVDLIMHNLRRPQKATRRIQRIQVSWHMRLI